LEDFRPHVIFSMVSSLSGLRMVVELADHLRIPIVPLVTDDYITTEYTRTYFSKPLRARLERAFRDYLDRAPIRLVISDTMAEAYALRYGGVFEPFTQGVDANAYDPAPHGDGGRERVRMVYAGNLVNERWRMLREIGTGLADLEHEGLRGELLIYS